MQMKCPFFAFLLLSVSLSGISAQDNPYIMHREAYKPGPSSLNFSPDGTLLLVGFAEGDFRVLDPESFQVLLEVPSAHSKAVTAIDMPPKMDFFLTAGGNEIKLWDRSGKHIGNFSGHATTIWNVDISGDGKYAVSSAFNKTFLLWDVYNGVIASYMRGHEDVVLSVCISPDNRLIASGSNDHTIKIWDLETRQVKSTLNGPTQDVFDVTFSPDSRMVAVASGERNIRVYSLEDSTLVHLLKGHRDAVRKVDFSPNGRYLISASEDHSLVLWDVTSGDRIHTFLENEDVLLDVQFHPDGGSFYSISRAGNLTRWKLDPEIFVVRYFDTAYQEALAAEPIFEPRRKTEAKKDFEARMEEAEMRKSEIIDRFYRQYLQDLDQ
jgi:dipeptidyl aminopeptidase/acylaminoacyl peptidase